MGKNLALPAEVNNGCRSAERNYAKKEKLLTAVQ
jgi:hypothetical protein